jgi:hypothetical protein
VTAPGRDRIPGRTPPAPDAPPHPASAESADHHACQDTTAISSARGVSYPPAKLRVPPRWRLRFPAGRAILRHTGRGHTNSSSGRLQLQTHSWLFTLAILTAACTAGDGLLTAPEANFNYAAGFTGEVGDAPPSLLADGITSDVAFPSTNADNEAAAWAHVVWASSDAGIGEAPLRFTSERGFASCFEYRIDDAETTDPRDNFNAHIADGLWPFVCVNNGETALELTAESHVDIRLAFGAERDERFDWTRFYVLTPLSRDDCRDGAWQELGFRNQG